MLQRLSMFVVALAALASTAVPARAQRASEATATAGPRVELTSTAMHASLAPTDRDAALAAATRRQGLGQPMAMMIVGGAALVAGVVIGGDAGTLIAIGGVVVGLIGLYQYLQ